MQLAIVKGRVTATVKHSSLAASKLLICELLGGDGLAQGDPVLAIDRLGAGAGDKVVLTTDGQGLRELVKAETCPARWWTVGIVD